MPGHPPAQPPRVAVLIPVYNGGDRLLEVLKGLEPHGLKVWVSDDGSTDGTAEHARRLGAAVVRRERRGGKGSALRRGFAAILAEGGVDWVVLMDGDGQHRPDEVPRFVKAMSGPYDLLMGTRLHEAHKFPGYRLQPNLIGSRILKWMSGHDVPDTQCGFRALRTGLLADLELESDGFEVETEMLFKALRRGARWSAVPVSAVYDGQGSHFRPVHDTVRICMAALRYVR